MRKLILLLSLICTISSWGLETIVDGVRYQLTTVKSEHHASVCGYTADLKANTVIPASITFDNVTYELYETAPNALAYDPAIGLPPTFLKAITFQGNPTAEYQTNLAGGWTDLRLIYITGSPYAYTDVFYQICPNVTIVLDITSTFLLTDQSEDHYNDYLIPVYLTDKFAAKAETYTERFYKQFEIHPLKDYVPIEIPDDPDNPIDETLTIEIAHYGGSMILHDAKPGHRFGIQPLEGYALQAVYLDESDITDTLEKGILTLPDLKGHHTLQIIYYDPSESQIDLKAPSAITPKFKNGKLYIENPENETYIICNPACQTIYTGKIPSPTLSEGPYILKTRSKAFQFYIK